MTVRTKDIAEDLGLSVVTISKVLRNHPDIAEETRQRVLRRVKELDYVPNVMARSLVTGRSYLIGLVVPDLLHPFFAEVAKALSAAVSQYGYSTIISSSEEHPELEDREIRTLTGRQLDALVIASCGTDLEAFSRIERHALPYVLIDRELPGLTANFVGVDDFAVGRIATEHLAWRGCRRIAHIQGLQNSTGIRRFDGYRAALKKEGIAYSDSLVVARPTVDIDSVRMGCEAMRLLLQRESIPDGVFAYNDPLAIGAMEAIFEAGLRIPRGHQDHRMRKSALRQIATCAAVERGSEQPRNRRADREHSDEYARVEDQAPAGERDSRTLPGGAGIDRQFRDKACQKRAGRSESGKAAQVS